MTNPLGTMTSLEILDAIRTYATSTKRRKWYGDSKDSHCGILSALVNLVDTARENPSKFQGGMQHEREAEIASFLFAHCPETLKKVI